MKLQTALSLGLLMLITTSTFSGVGWQTEAAFGVFPIGKEYSWQFVTVLNDSRPCYTNWLNGLSNLTHKSIISLSILVSTNTSLRYQISTNSQSFEQGFVLNFFLEQLGGDISLINLGYYFLLPIGEEFWNEVAVNISSTFPTASIDNDNSIFSFNTSTLIYQTYSWSFDKATGLLRSVKQVVRDPTMNYGGRIPDELYLLRTDLTSNLPKIILIAVGVLILSGFILLIVIRKKH